jgi:hypothetical protein
MNMTSGTCRFPFELALGPVDAGPLDAGPVDDVVVVNPPVILHPASIATNTHL